MSKQEESESEGCTALGLLLLAKLQMEESRAGRKDRRPGCGACLLCTAARLVSGPVSESRRWPMGGPVSGCFRLLKKAGASWSDAGPC